MELETLCDERLGKSPTLARALIRTRVARLKRQRNNEMERDPDMASHVVETALRTEFA